MQRDSHTVQLAEILLTAEVAKNGLPSGGSDLQLRQREQKTRDAFALAETFMVEADKRLGHT